MTPTSATPGQPSVRLRVPRWARIYALGFGLLWSGLLVAFAVRSPLSKLPVAAGMLLFAVLLVGSTLRLAVTATTDHLLVRNRLTTTTLTRAELTGFRAGPAPHQNAPLAYCAYALTTHRRPIPLTVTTRVGFGRPPDRVDHDVDLLQRWLNTGRQR